MTMLEKALTGLRCCRFECSECETCPYNFGNEDCHQLLCNDLLSVMERFTWIGKPIYLVVQDLDNELVLVEENVINEVGTLYFWCSDFHPAAADVSCMIPLDEIGKIAFFTREEAEKELKRRMES